WRQTGRDAVRRRGLVADDGHTAGQQPSPWWAVSRSFHDDQIGRLWGAFARKSDRAALSDISQRRMRPAKAASPRNTWSVGWQWARRAPLGGAVTEHGDQALGA